MLAFVSLDKFLKFMEGCTGNENWYFPPLGGNVFPNEAAFTEEVLPADTRSETFFELVDDLELVDLGEYDDNQTNRRRTHYPLLYIPRGPSVSTLAVINRININGSIRWSSHGFATVFRQALGPAIDHTLVQASVFVALVYDSEMTSIQDTSDILVPTPVLQVGEVFDTRLMTGVLVPGLLADYNPCHVPGAYSRSPAPGRYQVLWYQNFLPLKESDFICTLATGSSVEPPFIPYRDCFMRSRQESFRATIDCALPVQFSRQVYDQIPDNMVPIRGNVFFVQFITNRGRMAEFVDPQRIFSTWATSIEYQNNSN